MQTGDPGEGARYPSPGIFTTILRTQAAAWLRTGLTVAGVACLGVWTIVTVWAHVETSRNEARLERAIRAHSTTSSPVPVPAPAEGALLGRIDLPRTGVSAIVLEGIGTSVLAQAVGHVPGSALPGESGNIVLAGHRDSLFRGLRDVARGDTVTLLTPTGTRLYEVRSIAIVPPDDVSVLDPSAGADLTLITCFPFTYVGAAPERFVVRAVARGPVAPATAGARASLVAPAVPVRRTPNRPAATGGALPRAAAVRSKQRPPAVAESSPSQRVAPAPPAGRARISTPAAKATPGGHKRLHWWQRLFHHRAASSRSQRAH